jgi:hypothetical protein
MSHTMRRLAVIFGMTCLLFADDEPKRKVQIVHTEHTDFPSGGLLRLKNSIGELTVEGWDRPDVEITTIKSTTVAYASGDRDRAAHELDKVRISVERRGDEIVITTGFPRHRGPAPGSPLRPATSIDLDYHIKIPMNARLAVDHGTGEVHVDNLTSDIHITVRNGGITLLLPQEGKYRINARSDFGSVTSDLPGHEKRNPWLLGHQFVQGTSAPHNLYLTVGFGDIMIMKMQGQLTPGPLSH